MLKNYDDCLGILSLDLIPKILQSDNFENSIIELFEYYGNIDNFPGKSIFEIEVEINKIRNKLILTLLKNSYENKDKLLFIIRYSYNYLGNYLKLVKFTDLDNKTKYLSIYYDSKSEKYEILEISDIFYSFNNGKLLIRSCVCDDIKIITGPFAGKRNDFFGYYKFNDPYSRPIDIAKLLMYNIDANNLVLTTQNDLFRTLNSQYKSKNPRIVRSNKKFDKNQNIIFNNMILPLINDGSYGKFILELSKLDEIGIEIVLQVLFKSIWKNQETLYLVIKSFIEFLLKDIIEKGDINKDLSDKSKYILTNLIQSARKYGRQMNRFIWIGENKVLFLSRVSIYKGVYIGGGELLLSTPDDTLGLDDLKTGKLNYDARFEIKVITGPATGTKISTSLRENLIDIIPYSELKEHYESVKSGDGELLLSDKHKLNKLELLLNRFKENGHLVLFDHIFKFPEKMFDIVIKKIDEISDYEIIIKIFWKLITHHRDYIKFGNYHSKKHIKFIFKYREYFVNKGLTQSGNSQYLKIISNPDNSDIILIINKGKLISFMKSSKPIYLDGKLIFKNIDKYKDLQTSQRVSNFGEDIILT